MRADRRTLIVAFTHPEYNGLCEVFNPQGSIYRKLQEAIDSELAVGRAAKALMAAPPDMLTAEPYAVARAVVEAILRSPHG